MKKSFFSFVFCVICVLHAEACYNEYRILLTGEIIFADDEPLILNRKQFNEEELIKRLAETKKNYEKSGKIEDYSDYGVTLAFHKEYVKALKVFQEIEAKSPGLYNTSANLGTTYELLGNDEKAYFWIKKALSINPNSHEGSEWIHLKILEAKIASKNNPKYFHSHSVLNFNFGEKEIPENINKLDLKKLYHQLFHQLSELMTFIEPQEPIIAQLLFDLGNITALQTNDVKSALQVYYLAQEYGLENQLLKKRISKFEKLQSKADWKNFVKQPYNNSMFWLVILILLISGLVWSILWIFGRISRIKIRK